MKPSIKLLFLGAGVVVFALGIMALLTPAPRIMRSAPSAPITSLKGQLKFVTVDDFFVDHRKVILCGLQFTQPLAMRELVTDALRRSFQDKTVDCTPVGGGTPCDGNVAPRFRNTIVVQCTLDDGTDLAQDLIAKGYFCGSPKQSGGFYKGCGS